MVIKTLKRYFGLTRRRDMVGYVFVAPFIIGFLAFFLKPAFESLVFTFSDINLGATKYETTLVGLKNYKTVLLLDSLYVQILVRTVRSMAARLPLILIFSFLIAIFLNQNFKGRAFARAVCFIPVIITSGVLLKFEANSMALLNKAFNDSQSFEQVKNIANVTKNIENILMHSNLDQTFINYILGTVNEIYNVISLSGVQILIVLSALQTIPASLNEAAYMDGATNWEIFWKITFPYISPYLLVGSIYSIIDTFTQSTNEIIAYVHRQMFVFLNIGTSSVMSWIYFLIVVVFIGLILLIFSKKIFYEV